MKKREVTGLQAGTTLTVSHLQYSLSHFKNTAIIDADALQVARHSRGRPAAVTPIIIA